MCTNHKSQTWNKEISNFLLVPWFGFVVCFEVIFSLLKCCSWSGSLLGFFWPSDQQQKISLRCETKMHETENNLWSVWVSDMKSTSPLHCDAFFVYDCCTPEGIKNVSKKRSCLPAFSRAWGTGCGSWANNPCAQKSNGVIRWLCSPAQVFSCLVSPEEVVKEHLLTPHSRARGSSEANREHSVCGW